MKSCYHYCDEMNWLGYKGKCYGTKECEPCDCGGDTSKCDFYEEVRNKIEFNGNTVGRLHNFLHQYPNDMKVNVVIGNKIKPLSTVCTGVDMDTNETSVWLVGEY